MTKTSSQSIRKESGRLELVTNGGRKIPVNLTHRLPDKSRLTDPGNKALLETVNGVVEASYPRFQESSMSPIIGSLYLLIQWMFLRSIYRFGSLKRHHFKEFISDSAKGLDYCINATPRVREHLLGQATMSSVQRKTLTVHKVLAEVGIPPTYAPRLPQVSKLISSFIQNGVPALNRGPKKAKQCDISQATLRNRATAVDALWMHRETLADPASVDPFSADERALFRRKGRKGKQTPVAPRSVALKMYIAAMDVVMTVGPAAIEWDRARSGPLANSTLEANCFERLSALLLDRWQTQLLKKANRKLKSIGTTTLMTRIIPIACQITILAYVGRRQIEVESLASTCISGTPSEGRTLMAYIAKRQTHETRPCPEVVARAVELMTAYQGQSPASPGELFKLRGKNVRMKLSAFFDQFAALIDGLAYTDSQGHACTWHWAPHQLRRLYVVIYIWRYDDASFLALRHHLGHGSEAESAYYARLSSDGNFAELAEEAGIFTVERLREIANGHVVGPFAQIVAKRIERIRSNLRLTSEKSLEKVLGHLVKNEQLIIHASPWGYCGCKAMPSNMRRAQCRQGARATRPVHPVFNTPIPGDSEEETCAKCIFFSTGPSRKPHWQNVIIQANRSIDGTPESSILKKLLKSRRDENEANLQRFFPDPVEVTGA